MSGWSDLLKKLAIGAERSEGRVAAEGEEALAKKLAGGAEEAVTPNFTMSDSTSMPGAMGHNQAQADYIADQAAMRAKNANEGLPVALGNAFEDQAEKGLVPSYPKSLAPAAPEVIDAEFKNLKDPVTRSLLQKYGKAGLAAAGVGGLLAGYGMIPDAQEPKKIAPPVAPIVPEEPKVGDEQIKAAIAAPVSKVKQASAPKKEEVDPRDKLPELSTDREPSNMDALKKLLTIQFGDKTQASVDKLKKVQRSANADRAMGETARAVSEFADAMTGIKDYKSDKGLYDRAIAGADKQVEQYKEQVAAEKTDPNSAYSTGMRDYMKRFGVNVTGQASGADIEKIAPQLAGAYEKDQALAQAKELKDASLKQQAFENQMKREEHGMDREVKKAQISALKSAKDESATNKDFASLSKDLQEPYKARSGALGRAAQTIRQADAIDALMATGKLEGSFQLRELAASFDSMLRGGQTAVSSMNELVPHDMVGDAAKIKEWLTSEPAAQDRKPLLNLMKKLTDRERATAENQIKDAQIAVAAHRYPRLVGKPEYDNILDSLGIKEDTYATRSGKGASKTKDYLKKLTTADEELAPVTIKRKSDGLTKTVPADQAKKFLDDPAYEKVK